MRPFESRSDANGSTSGTWQLFPFLKQSVSSPYVLATTLATLVAFVSPVLAQFPFSDLILRKYSTDTGLWSQGPVEVIELVEFLLPAGTIKTVAGSGGTPNYDGLTVAMAVDDRGNLFIAQASPSRILRLASGRVFPEEGRTGGARGSTAGIDTVSTVIGNGARAFGGDGGPAISAQIGLAGGLAMDEMGNLFIADSSNNRIRKVSQDGTIRTLAGNGKPGFSGDGGPGVSAQLNAPTALTVDGRGNLFIVDTGNNRIRKLSSDGSISTVAGTGRVGFSGDGRPAASAAFNRPTGVAIDGEGNVYVADTLNHRVRKISAEGLVTTIAGNGKAASNGDGGPAVSASINEPKGLAVDRVGNVFVTDFGDGRHGSDNGVRPGEYKNGRVRKILKSGSISTVSGPQAPFQAEIPWNPQGVAVDREGSLYVVDTYRRIAKIAADGTTTALKMYSSPGYSVPPGDSGDFGPAVFAQLNKPASVAADDAGNIFIADQGNYRIRKVGPSGVITPFAGTAGVRGYGGDDGPANAARFGDAIRIAVDREGNVFVADPTNQRVRKILVSGVIQTVAGNGTAGYSGDGGPAVSAQLNNPLDVSVDREGNIFIADRGNARVRKVSPSGVISTVAGNGRRGFSGDGGRATAARLGILGTIAVDDRGTIFIATVDVGGYRNVYRVRKISQGIISTVDRTRFPAHAVIAVHPDGTLFGTDGARILMMRPSGAGVIVAGGMSSFNGDNAPIYSLGVSPHDLWIDRSGDIYIADGHHRIRKVVLPLQRNP